MSDAFEKWFKRYWLVKDEYFESNPVEKERVAFNAGLERAAEIAMEQREGMEGAMPTNTISAIRKEIGG